MIRELILRFQDWSGLDTPQLQWIGSMIAIVGGLGIWLGRIWGWRKAKRELRLFYKGLDDANIVIERLIFLPQTDRTTIFDRETEEGVRPLAEVLGGGELVNLVRAAISVRVSMLS